MNAQRPFKQLGLFFLSVGLLLAGCMEDSYTDFSARDENQDEQVFTICDNSAAFPAEVPVTAANFIGEYVKTRELACGISGCNEAPFITVHYAGALPSLILKSDGTIQNPDGPFAVYDSWTFIPSESSDVPNRLALVDSERSDVTFQVSILSTGFCRIRLENGQGWIEYTRLEEV